MQLADTITIEEAADHLLVQCSDIRQLIDDGELESPDKHENDARVYWVSLNQFVARKNAMPDRSDFLNVKQVAVYLGTTGQHVKNMIQSNKLPAYDIGAASHKIWRVRRSDLESFLMVRGNQCSMYMHGLFVPEKAKLRKSKRARKGKYVPEFPLTDEEKKRYGL